MNGQRSSNGLPSGRSRRKGSRWGTMLRLLYPGLGVKRWLLAGAFGIAVISIGFAFMIRKLFAISFPDFLPSYFEGLLLLVVGSGVILLAMYGLFRSIGPLILESSSLEGIAETIYTRRSLGRGPKIVAIGGGTGLSVLLRGLKEYTDNLTAVVTVGDDGGSSGRLRRELGVLPPGDFRNCLVALADEDTLLAELFQYRFDQGDGLKGHSFGNLFIVAMTNVTHNFEQALYESSRVLAVHGTLVPATMANLQLSANLKDGSTIHGESRITERGGDIANLFIRPADAEPSPMAVDAISDADLIVIGPGSLYTSILPNLLVRGIASAIGESSATKIYVCNVATQIGETGGYSVSDHLGALQEHTFTEIVDYVVANHSPIEMGDQYLGAPVVHGGAPLRYAVLKQADLADLELPVRHDSVKLAREIMDVYRSDRKNNASLGFPVGSSTRN